VPFRVNGVKVATTILRGKQKMIIYELKKREDD
jgi:hypothetical protein